MTTPAKTDPTPPKHPNTATATQPGPAGVPVHGLQPQRKLLAILSVVTALWVAMLIGMYIKWVWPERRGVDRPVATQPAE